MLDNNNWEGFDRPDKRYFRVSHNFIEALARIESLCELKIVLYILRHTWGFNKFEVPTLITMDEFVFGRRRKNGTRMDRGTQLSEQGARSGIRKAMRDGFVECITDDTDKGRVRNYYRLLLRDDIQFDTQEEISDEKFSLVSRRSNTRSAPPPEYYEYIKSYEWQKKRAGALRFAQFRCQICNSPEDLEVHHRSYKNLGYEQPSDLTVLCDPCHELFHNSSKLTK